MKKVAIMFRTAVPVLATLFAVSLPAEAAPNFAGRALMRSSSSASVSSLAATVPAPVTLGLDDGSIETVVGLNSASAAYQFLWFNRFTPPAGDFPFRLETIAVAFVSGSGVNIGDAIQLIVYTDPDGDPSNGAMLLATFNETVQALDTFSTYNLSPPVILNRPGDVLIGVVNRFVISGVTPIGYTATLDTTASQGRSWVAIWNADPPDPPTLPTDLPGGMVIIDSIGPGFAGNWLIRGSGTRISTPAPVLSPWGLGTLIALLAALGGFVAWRGHRARGGCPPAGLTSRRTWGRAVP
jgi:hypothetical protein